MVHRVLKFLFSSCLFVFSYICFFFLIAVKGIAKAWFPYSRNCRRQPPAQLPAVCRRQLFVNGNTCSEAACGCLRLPAASKEKQNRVLLFPCRRHPTCGSPLFTSSHNFISPMKIHIIHAIFIICDCKEAKWHCSNNLLFKAADILSLRAKISKSGIHSYRHGYRWSNMGTLCLRHTAGTDAGGCRRQLRLYGNQA